MLAKKLDEFTKEYCEKTGFTGILRLTLKDEILYERSLGCDNLTSESMFSLYSLSKPFCAIGLMRLYDRGLVDIDAHPSKYLDAAKVLDKDMTLRHIMTHTSGIPDFYMEPDFADIDGTPETMREKLPELFAKPAYFKAGTQAKYANINYNIMAFIIENVTGMPYAEYMKKEVFEKLGLPHAVVDKKDLFIPDRVQGYAIEDDKIVPVDRNAFCMFGAGDIVGTVEDVYRLNHAVKHKLLLTEESWKQVLTPSPLNHMGFGCTVKRYGDKTRVTHNGGHTGFRTYHIHLLEDDFDVVLLSNSGWGLGRNAIETAVYEAFYGFDITNREITPMDTGYI